MKKFLRKFLPVFCCLVLMAAMLVPVSAATTEYMVYLDGQLILSHSSSVSTIELEITPYFESAAFRFTVSGSDSYDKGYINSDYKRFAGLSRFSNGEQVEYAARSDGSPYFVLIPSTSPVLNLYSVYEYSLTIDPHHGKWNGSSSPSVFWGLPSSELEDIADPVFSGYNFAGWYLLGAGRIDSLNPPTYTFGRGAATLTASWSAVGASNLTTTVNVAPDFSVSFPGSLTASPTVTVQCYGSGALFTVGDVSYMYPYTGSGTFLGLALSDYPDALYAGVGETVGLSGASSNMVYSFVPVVNDLPPDASSAYTTTVRVYNSLGTTLLTSWAASSLPGNISPSVQLIVTESGIRIRPIGSDSGPDWLRATDGFLGFSTSPNGPIVYPADGTYVVGGERSNTNVDLYAVYDVGFADPDGIDFVAWLVTAIDGFLDFSLWPGMSLSDLLWVCLCIGILFWFLRVVS